MSVYNNPVKVCLKYEKCQSVPTSIDISKLELASTGINVEGDALQSMQFVPRQRSAKYGSLTAVYAATWTPVEQGCQLRRGGEVGMESDEGVS